MASQNRAIKHSTSLISPCAPQRCRKTCGLFCRLSDQRITIDGLTAAPYCGQQSEGALLAPSTELCDEKPSEAEPKDQSLMTVSSVEGNRWESGLHDSLTWKSTETRREVLSGKAHMSVSRSTTRPSSRT